MARGRYAGDRGLTSRMVLTMFILGLIYVAFIGFFIALKLWPLVALAAVMFFVQFFASDKIALFSMGGRVVTPEQEPELHAIVDRVCAMANLPKPKVAVVEVDQPNAFATGRNQKSAVICATRGIMNRLEPEELEGVLAHEMSHVAHKDVAVMTIASFLGVLAGLLTRVFMYAGLFGGGRRDSNDSSGVIIALIMLVSMVVYALSFLLIRLLSRYRELSADRSAAMLTGRPSALASALQKVTGDMARIPQRDLRKAEAFNAFFFTPALAKDNASLASLFSTHPSLEKRLDQLAKIQLQLNSRSAR